MLEKMFPHFKKAKTNKQKSEKEEQIKPKVSKH